MKISLLSACKAEPKMNERSGSGMMDKENHRRTPMKRRISLGLAALALVWMSLNSAANAETTIRVSSWLTPTHGMNAIVWPTWAKQVEEATASRVKVQIEYNLGPPPAQMDLIRDGVADVSWIFHGYNPGRFVLTKVVELPGLGTSAEAASVAYWRVYQKYFAQADEHQGVTLIGLTSHGPGIIHTKQPVTQLDELKGMKIRIGGGVSADVGTALGVVGVQVPAPKVYETLAQGVADGIFMPMETKKSLRLKEVAPFSMVMPGGLYYGSFAFIMNTNTLESLDPKDREALLSVSGEALSKLAGRTWDQQDAEALKDATASGNTVVTASDEVAKQYKELVAPIEQAWIAEASGKGVDAAAALKELRDIAHNYKPD
jgi:TRAP-type C4-dicarboxylate transport system substrate-binding protein